MAELVDLSEVFSRRSVISEPPEDSVLKEVLPIHSEPGIVIYGPTKSGKTRLAAWEATALATKLNRRVVFLLTESNVEQEDVGDILAACAYHSVFCEVHRFDHVKGLANFVSKMERNFSSVLKRDKESEAERRAKLELMAKVAVIDSVTGMANLVVEGLSETLLEAGSSSILQYIYPNLTKVVNPLRRLLSAEYLNGYLIMVAHEMHLRGGTYSPGTGVKSKPRYMGAVQYNDDAEVYLGSPGEMPDALASEEVRQSISHYRPLITVLSRRNPGYVGTGLAVRFVRLGEEPLPVRKKRKKKDGQEEQQEPPPPPPPPHETYGLVEKISTVGGAIYVYTPKDMLADESQAKKIIARPLMPVVGYGPRKVS